MRQTLHLRCNILFWVFRFLRTWAYAQRRERFCRLFDVNKRYFVVGSDACQPSIQVLRRLLLVRQR